MKSRAQSSTPKLRTQKNPRPRPKTALWRTDPLEAKDRNARGQGKRLKTQTQVFSKKKGLQIFFQTISKKSVFKQIFQAISERGIQKRSSQVFRKVSNEILRVQKIVLLSSRGQGNFRGLEALRQGQGLDLRGQGQGFQNVSSRTSLRWKTSSRTPPLLKIRNFKASFLYEVFEILTANNLLRNFYKIGMQINMDTNFKKFKRFTVKRKQKLAKRLTLCSRICTKRKSI